MPRKPLEPAVAAAKGLSPAERAKAMREAKDAAFDVVHAVQWRHAPMVQKAADELSPQAWAALVLVLAEVADLWKLKAVRDVPDNGMPLHVGGERRTA